MVPIENGTTMPVREATSWLTRRIRRRLISSSSGIETSGIITSRVGAMPCWVLTSIQALNRPSTCAGYRPSWMSARRTPRTPSIGFSSCRLSAILAQFSSTTSCFVGKNSCIGASSRRTVTGRLPTARRRSRKSSRCASASAASAASSSSGLEERITRRMNGSRSPRNMCSVRHRPIPSAPLSIATPASTPVSALARMPSRRTSSAQFRTVANANDGSGRSIGTAPT